MFSLICMSVFGFSSVHNITQVFSFVSIKKVELFRFISWYYVDGEALCVCVCVFQKTNYEYVVTVFFFNLVYNKFAICYSFHSSFSTDSAC